MADTRTDPAPERPESPSEEAYLEAQRVVERCWSYTSDENIARIIGLAIDAAREQGRRDRDMEWWEAIVQVDGVAPSPEAAKKFLLDLATHEQEGAREQGRREGLEQAASLVLRLTPYLNLADAILAFAEVPKG